MRDLGLLVIRLAVGGLLAGHGAQKLFGLFGGYGLKGTAQWLESLGLKPGDTWALAAAGGEFGSGLLTAAGFLHPAGPIGVFGPMLVATGTVHRDKPIWVTAGGPELPIVNMAVAAGLTLAGPGRYSLDRLVGFGGSPVLGGLAAAAVAAGTVVALLQASAPAEPEEITVSTETEAPEGTSELNAL